MEVTLRDGPRTVGFSSESTAFSRRDLDDTDRAPRLWLTTVTLEMRAPVSWWKQARGYFPEVLWVRAREEWDANGDRNLKQDDFEDAVPEALLVQLNELIKTASRSSLQALLPASFIRRGIVHTNLTVLRDILRERGHYNEGHWSGFCTGIREEPELAAVLSALKT